jgi:hypothetical protein
MIPCQRLDAKYDTDPTAFNVLYEIVRKEIAAKTARGSSSSTNGLLWLTRLGFLTFVPLAPGSLSLLAISRGLLVLHILGFLQSVINLHNLYRMWVASCE